jgi:hypothetical protein
MQPYREGGCPAVHAPERRRLCWRRMLVWGAGGVLSIGAQKCRNSAFKRKGAGSMTAYAACRLPTPFAWIGLVYNKVLLAM